MAKARHFHRSVSVDVDITEFDDDAIIDEAIRRDLTKDIVRQAAGEPEEKTVETDPKQLAGDVLNHLMCRRPERASLALQSLIAMFVPEEIVAAAEAMHAGRMHDVISELDRYIDPSPARTAETLPKREALNA